MAVERYLYIMYQLFSHCNCILIYPPTQVPSSYVALQKKVSEEVMRCREKETPPVLNQMEFSRLAQTLDDNDITDPEELSLGENQHALSSFISTYTAVSVVGNGLPESCLYIDGPTHLLDPLFKLCNFCSVGHTPGV